MNKDSANPASSSKLVAFNNSNVRTIVDLFYQGMTIAKQAGDSRFLGFRTGWNKSCNNFAWISYEQVESQARSISKGLLELGLSPGNSTKIGIYSLNCPDWLISALACTFQSWIIVPLYHTSSDSTLMHIVGECELRTCFVKSGDDINRFLKLLVGCPIVQLMISFVEPTDKQVQQADEYNVRLISITELQKQWKREDMYTFCLPKPDDLTSICYTSGTTGPPKGAMLSHGNFVSVTDAQAKFFEQIEDPGKECMVSYLPLAHTLGFGLEISCMARGYKIAYYSGDIKKLFDDLKEVRPTLFPTVPRLLNRVYGEIQKKIDRKRIGVFKSALFKFMFGLKRRALCKGDYRRHIADRVVFGPIQSMFGERLKLVLVGSSPSTPEVLGFMKVVLGCIVIEGYGQTECTGASHSQPLYDMSVSNVGKPIQCCEAKIIDAAELKYYARNNSGELCIRGHNVFRGYYKNPEKTKEVLDEHGWLHTGDIVLQSKDGTFSVVDRRNEIFKLSQGEYVVPSKIENVYHNVDIVQQCFVYGSPFKSFLVAVIVPDKDALLKVAQKYSIPGEYSSLCKNKQINSLILNSLTQASKAAQLSGVERIRGVVISEEPFTIDNGLLTPTMKLRRGVCARHFRTEIDALYNASVLNI